MTGFKLETKEEDSDRRRLKSKDKEVYYRYKYYCIKPAKLKDGSSVELDCEQSTTPPSDFYSEVYTWCLTEGYDDDASHEQPGAGQVFCPADSGVLQGFWMEEIDGADQYR